MLPGGAVPLKAESYGTPTKPRSPGPAPRRARSLTAAVARNDFTSLPQIRASGGLGRRAASAQPALGGGRDLPEQRLQEAKASSTTHTSWTLILASPLSRK